MKENKTILKEDIFQYLSDYIMVIRFQNSKYPSTNFSYYCCIFNKIDYLFFLQEHLLYEYIAREIKFESVLIYQQARQKVVICSHRKESLGVWGMI